MKTLFIFMVSSLSLNVFSQQNEISKKILLDSVKYYSYDSICFFAEYFKYNNEDKMISMETTYDKITYTYYPDKYEIYSYQDDCSLLGCDGTTSEKFSTIYFNSKGLDTLICDSIISESDMVSPDYKNYIITIDNYYRFYDSYNRDTLDLYIDNKCYYYNSTNGSTVNFYPSSSNKKIKKVTYYNESGLDTLSITYKFDSMQYWVRNTFFVSGLDSTFIIYEADLSYPIKNSVSWYMRNRFMKSYNPKGQLIKYATSWHNAEYLEHFEYYYDELGKVKTVCQKEANYKKIYYYSNESSATLIKDITKGLIISPNSIMNNLYINSPYEILKFNLVDLNGRIIISGNNCQNSINISHVKSGIYILNIQTKSTYYTSKIIKY